MSPHAAAMDAAFLERLPAPPAPSAVCVVDTGVTLTPDTQTILLERRTVAGGTSLDDLEPAGHGTQVASLIAAPRNGWGGVGIWPGAGIVSVRASQLLVNGAATFAWPDYARGVRECVAAKEERGLPVTVINLSLGGGFDPAGAVVLDRAVKDALSAGMSVVVAAGNDSTRPGLLTTVPGVIAVGGHDLNGVRCDFSPTGPAILMAPGCGVHVADIAGQTAERSGTSLAAPHVSALLATLRAYAPALTREDAEAALVAGARGNSADTPRASATAAFRAAGLGGLVPAATPAQIAPAPPARVTVRRSPPALRLRGAPRLRGRWLAVPIRPAPTRRGLLIRLRVEGSVRASWPRAVPPRARVLRLRLATEDARTAAGALSHRASVCAPRGRAGSVCLEWRGPGRQRFGTAPVRLAATEGRREHRRAAVP